MFLLAFLPILILFVILAYLIYMGAFLPIAIEEKNIGPFHFVYKEINAKDFSLVGRTTDEIAKILNQYNLSNPKPLQIFYPDEQKKLVEVGFAVEEKLSDIGDVKYRSIPAALSLTASYPWRNSLSFVLGFMKVDPALRNYRSSKGYKKTEAMVILENDTIQYMQPVEKMAANLNIMSSE